MPTCGVRFVIVERKQKRSPAPPRCVCVRARPMLLFLGTPSTLFPGLHGAHIHSAPDVTASADKSGSVGRWARRAPRRWQRGLRKRGWLFTAPMVRGGAASHAPGGGERGRAPFYEPGG